jgi:hypothetical protein
VNALQTIIARAAEKSLEFILAGGHAVIMHGHPRATFDLDLIIRRDDRERWRRVAQDLGYRSLREGPTFLQYNPPNSESLPLDLMFVNSETFAKLMAEAIPGPAGVEAAKVVSLRHLLALKCHAIKHGHAGRIVKDVDDVIRLVQVNRLDPNAPEMGDLFLKHGTKELYEKVRRICGPC